METEQPATADDVETIARLVAKASIALVTTVAQDLSSTATSLHRTLRTAAHRRASRIRRDVRG